MKIFRLFVLSTLICFGLLPATHAVVPAPDGGYPDNNSTGSNTDNGAYALVTNTEDNKTANGSQALEGNTTGDNNTVNGAYALKSNTTGTANTATGVQALLNNTTGTANTANGSYALINNTTGSNNTANGSQALYRNTTGTNNTAYGVSSLYHNTSGNLNAALGYQAGLRLTSGSGNVDIGAGVFGVPGENNTTRVRNVYASVATGRPVYVNSDNKLGTLPSSQRYEEEIKPMDKASETIFALRPVSFRYKKEVDAARAISFGLIAEDVAKVSPELITRDEKDNPQTVRYEAVNAMLLNEFLKEHKTVQEQDARLTKQEALITRQQKQIETLTAAVQKVSAQLELSKSSPQTVRNDQ